MNNEVRLAVISGSAQILVAAVALFGTLATASGTDAKQTPSAVLSSAAATTAAPATGVSCEVILEQYWRLVQLDKKLINALITEGPDGVSPVGADPNARRCGISAKTLQALR